MCANELYGGLGVRLGVKSPSTSIVYENGAHCFSLNVQTFFVDNFNMTEINILHELFL